MLRCGWIEEAKKEEVVPGEEVHGVEEQRRLIHSEISQMPTHR
jgi:hypothetical protein